MTVLRLPALPWWVALVGGAAYGVFARDQLREGLGVSDLVLAVVMPSQFTSYVLLPIALLVATARARRSTQAVRVIRHGSRRGLALSLMLEALRFSAGLVVAAVVGSAVAGIGLPFSAPADLEAVQLTGSPIAWPAFVAAQLLALTLAVTAVQLVCTVPSVLGLPRSYALDGAVASALWVAVVGSFNGLWPDDVARPVWCAFVVASCGTTTEGLATAAVALGTAVVGVLLAAAAVDLHHRGRGSVALAPRVVVALTVVILVTVTSSLAIADSAPPDAPLEELVAAALSGDAASPITLLLALCSFAAMLLVFSLRLDGASAGFADLERLRAGSWLVAAARALLAATVIAFVVRAGALLGAWMPLALTGRSTVSDPSSFLLGALVFVVVGSLWWGLLALAVALVVRRWSRAAMVVPVACAVAVTLQLVRLVAGSGEQSTLWPALDAFAEPLAGGPGRPIEAGVVLIIAAGFLTGARVALARARRAPRSARTPQEAVS